MFPLFIQRLSWRLYSGCSQFDLDTVTSCEGSALCLQPGVVSLCVEKYCHSWMSLCHELSSARRIEIVWYFDSAANPLDFYMCFCSNQSSHSLKDVKYKRFIQETNFSSTKRPYDVFKKIFNIWFASVEVWTLRSFFSWKLWQQSDWRCLVFIATCLHQCNHQRPKRKENQTSKRRI